MTEQISLQEELTHVAHGSHLRTANGRVLVNFAVARPALTVKQAAAALGMRYQGRQETTPWWASGPLPV
ncbi:MAG TPA: hypothetical protein VES01_04455 [Dermatophilaceae bacterium]|nr:hypothetical protein [Dermatophilaceae bacterium]